MKKILATALLFIAVQPALSLGAAKVKAKTMDTRIIETKISYARALRADDRQGFPVYMAAIGGQILFEGNTPVFATLKLGGQSYTVAADRLGYFSTFVYTNGYNDFTVEGWSPNESAGQHRALPIVEGFIK